MISQTIAQLWSMLSEINAQLALGLVKHIEHQLTLDTERLHEKDPHFLDGSEGFVDYYSPHAKEQLQHQHDLLNSYLHYVLLIEATLFCIMLQDKEASNLTSLGKDSVKCPDLKLKKLKKSIHDLHHIQNPSILSQRKDIQTAIEMLHQKNLKEECILQKLSLSNPLMHVIDLLQKRKSNLTKKLRSTKRLIEKIPNGMMDIKRALYLLREKRKETSLHFSDSEAVDEIITHLLHDLKRLMALTLQDYQKLVMSGGEFHSFLHKTTAFFWESMKLYRQMVETGTEYLCQAPLLTPQGEFVTDCFRQAILKMHPKALIDKAIKQVHVVDNHLDLRKKAYARILWNETPVQFYQPIVEEMMADHHPDCPFFYIPYQVEHHVMDHPANSDLAEVLGNCFGESMMFLQRINAEKPMFMNICPEKDLINFQLNQGKKLVGCKDIIVQASCSKTREMGKIQLRDIEDLITQDTKSRFGDLCLLRFGGAEIEGREATLGHGLALIKLRSGLSPYSYVIYDHHLGIMGCSTFLQVKSYLRTVLNIYYDFFTFKLEKHGEVSEACFHFINAIHPLEKPDATIKCRRNFWDEERLQLLSKYHSTKQFMMEENACVKAYLGPKPTFFGGRALLKDSCTEKARPSEWSKENPSY